MPPIPEPLPSAERVIAECLRRYVNHSGATWRRPSRMMLGEALDVAFDPIAIVEEPLDGPVLAARSAPVASAGASTSRAARSSWTRSSGKLGRSAPISSRPRTARAGGHVI